MTFGKRIDRPGGSRRAKREEVLMSAAMMTTMDSLTVDLLDLSNSGARLRGNNLPPPGLEVLVLLGSLEAFGSVVWRIGDQCGVQFDVALSEGAVAAVERERGPSRLRGLGSDAVLASADWENGLAR
jgi:hypothetical protein